MLIITYYWPPSGGGGVQRWLKFTKYFQEKGWQPIVYVPENAEYPATDEKLSAEIHESVRVISQPIWEPYALYKKFTARDKDAKIATGFTSEKGKISTAEKVSRWVRGNLFIPDARKFWIKPSVKYLSNFIREHEVNAVISTGPPHSMHLIAQQLRRKFKIPWIADFRDPWTTIDYVQELSLTKSSKNKHDQLETAVLTEAQKVIVVGKSMKDEFSHKVSSSNIEVVPNGYDEDDFTEGKKELDEKFSMAHIGSFSPSRNIQAFWQALSELAKDDSVFKNDLQVKLIGAVDGSVYQSIGQFGLEEQVESLGYMAHDEVLNHTLGSQVLLLFINRTHNAKSILTGKVFEYLKSGRPLLTIAPPDGDLAELLEKVEADSIIDYDEISDIKTRILAYYEEWRKGKLHREYQNIQQYSRRNLSHKVASMLDEITDSK